MTEDLSSAFVSLNEAEFLSHVEISSKLLFSLDKNILQRLYDYGNGIVPGRGLEVLSSLSSVDVSIFQEVFTRKGVRLSLKELKATSPRISYGDKFDPSALVEQLISSGLDESVLSDVNDQDAPRAKNVVDWMLGKNFLSLDREPFPKQLEAAVKLFSDYCPVCSDTKFFDNIFDEQIQEILDRVMFLEHGVCPKCHKNRIELEPLGLIPRNELCLAVGRRSGKTALMSGICATYQLHRFLTLPKSPHKIFKLLKGQDVRFTFTAFSTKQAERDLWRDFKSSLDEAPWFKSYHAMLDDMGKRVGGQLYRTNISYLYYDHKKIFGSFENPDSRLLRGPTRAFSAIDELAVFDSDRHSSKVKANAHETYTVLDVAMKTIRASSKRLMEAGDFNIPTALMLCGSSVMDAFDKIMALVKESQVKKSIIAYHLATWEFNPDLPIEAFSVEERSAADFDREYGSIPPLAENPFLHLTEAQVRDLIDTNRSQIGRYKVIHSSSQTGSLFTHLKILSLLQDNKTTRVLTVDAGETHNSFALVLGQIGAFGEAIVELILEAVPEREGDRVRVVNFDKMFKECIVPIVSSLKVDVVLYDRWESSDHISRLENDHHQRAEKKTLTFADFSSFRNKATGGLLSLPKPQTPISTLLSGNYPEPDDPAGRLIIQMLTVKEAGRKVIKPRAGQDDTRSDDLFRCLVLLSECGIRSSLVMPENVESTTVKRVSVYRKSGASAGFQGRSKGVVAFLRKRAPIPSGSQLE